MKPIITCFVLALSALLTSCIKDPMEEISAGDWNKERNIISLTLQNQIGPAQIIRNETEQKLMIYVDPEGLEFSSVEVMAMELSYKATSDVQVTGKMNFDNPEYTGQITVTSYTGEDLVWDVILQPYEWFYLGTWSVQEERIFVRQEWGSDFNKNIVEVAPDAIKEMDNAIEIINEGVRNGKPYGKIINNAGTDGEFGSFIIPDPGGDVDMNPKLRILIPTGESTWEIDLATNIISISKSGITANALITKESFGIRLSYDLPQTDRWNVKWDYGNYDNYWCWSYKYTIDLF